MSIKLYNTLTRKKETFQPIRSEEVTFYVCGPTVYNYIHIGNARSTVAFDTIRRYLEYRGYNVNYVSNFTDVDDKIIAVAKEEGVEPTDIANKYIKAFHEDVQALNVKPATTHPRVTTHISSIVKFIQQLMEQGFAYESQGDVYFRTRQFDDYGKLSHQSLDKLQTGASQRVSEEEKARKEDPLDFVLWRGTSTQEWHWESPWGPGRPGWHIECSAMSIKLLGNTIDIHGGGQDLEFPHHENEIAQSESCTGEVFSNYWLHNGFVTFGEDDEKMSKSLGNFVLLRDLLKEEDPMVVRYLLGSVHYRRPLVYDVNTLEEARNTLRRFKDMYRRLDYRQKDALDQPICKKWEDEIKTYREDFIASMDDDFNAANAFAVIFDLLRHTNQYLEEKVSRETLQQLKKLMDEFLDVFGIVISVQEELLEEDIQQLIEEREVARAEGNYERSDDIRDQLHAQGIELNDTPQGTQWRRFK